MKTTLQRLWLLTIMTFATIGANAYQFEVDGIRYNVTSSASPYTVEVVSRQGGYTGNINIPTVVSYYNTNTHNYNYYEVTKISGEAFSGCTDLTSVSIPNSVTEIENGAFFDCTGLSSISIPNSVTIIGGSAFGRCTGLTSVTMGNGVTQIGHTAFAECTSLTSISIPDSVTFIGSNAFFGCTGLTSVTIGKGDTQISDNAFDDCTGLTSVTVNCRYIGSCFSGMSSIQNLTLGNTVKKIGDYAFAGCSGLTAVTIPQSVDSIGGGAFKQCPTLTSITCERETPCVLSSTESDYIKSINLYVSWDAVPNYNNAEVWRNFKNIYSSNTIGGYGVAYRRYSQSYLVIVSGGGYENHLDIQDTYNYNGSEYYVRKIGEKAFYGNNSFKSLFLHRGIEEIGDKAFYGCDSLKSVTVDDRISAWEITHTSTSFSNMSDITLYVPDGSKALYEGATFWNQFGTIVEGLEVGMVFTGGQPSGHGDLTYRVTSNADHTVAVIGGDAEDWRGAGYPPSTTTSIRDRTFNITSVADYAFDGRGNVNSLSRIYMPVSITSIGNYAFRNTNLTSFGFWVMVDGQTVTPQNVVAIGKGAFKGCTQLTHCYPNISTIGDEAFYGCTGLQTVSFGNSLTSIGDQAFRGCTGLTSLPIPGNVTSIGNSAFYGCTGLTKVRMYSKIPPTVGSGAFPDGTTLFVPRDCKTIYEATPGYEPYNIVERAYDFVADGIGYIITSSVAPYTVEVTFREEKYTGNNDYGVISIPDSVYYNNRSYAVTGIGDEAFRNCTELHTIEIPHNIIHIGDYAFAGCNGYVETRGSVSFTVPESVTSIGSHAFDNPSLQESQEPVTMEPTVPPTVGDTPFLAGTTLVVPQGCKEVYENTSGYEPYTIMEWEAEIGKYIGHQGIHYEVTGDGSTVSVFGCDTDWDFGNAITIPDTITYMGQSFAVTAIGEYAFSQLYGVDYVIMESETPPILEGSYEIQGMTLIVPENCTQNYIESGNGSWGDFRRIMEEIPTAPIFTVDGINYRLETREENGYTDTYAVVSEGDYSGDIVIPYSVTYGGETYNVRCIGASAFWGCNELTSITTGGTTGVIRNGSSVIAHEGHTRKWAFYGCDLGSIELPPHAMLDDFAFYGCGISEVYIPLIYTGNPLPINGSCQPDEWPEVYPQLSSSNVFGDVSTAMLYVPLLWEEAFRNSEGWSEFRDIKSLYYPEDFFIYEDYYNGNRHAYKPLDYCNAFLYLSGHGDIPEKVNCNGYWLSVYEIGDYGAYYEGRDHSVQWGDSTLIIPSWIRNIWNGAFRFSRLSSVTFPEDEDAQLYVADRVFANCESLHEVTIPANVSLGDSVFYNTPLTSVTVKWDTPPQLQSDAVFSNASEATLWVPKGCSFAYRDAEYWRDFKKIMEKHDENDYLIDGIYYRLDGGAYEYCAVVCGYEEVETDCDNPYISLTIPEQVVINGESHYVGVIDNLAFADFKELGSITIPSSVKLIGADAFVGCENLHNLYISDIAAWCRTYFAGTNSNPMHEGADLSTVIGTYEDMGGEPMYGYVQNLVIPDGVSNISDYAFYGCTSLTSITIPSSITSIGDRPFYGYNLTSVTVQRSIPIYINENTFPGCENATLYVPYGCKALYEADEYWNRFGEIIEYGEEGDINSDGEISVADISTQVNVLLQRNTDDPGRFNTIAGDMNNDGQITIADVTKLVNKILGKE